jgi:protocatechuate 3,4-dioxygenase beta subunit
MTYCGLSIATVAAIALVAAAEPGGSSVGQQTAALVSSVPNNATYSFAGTVVDEKGHPVADAKISLSYFRRSPTPARIAPDAVSDARGTFEFSRKTSDFADLFETWYSADVRLIATKDGYGFASVPAAHCEPTGQLARQVRDWVRQRKAPPLGNGTNILTLIADDVPIRGRLLTTDRRPVAGAKIEVVGAWAGDNGSLAAFEENVKRYPGWQHVSILFKGYAGAGMMYYAGRRRLFGAAQPWDAPTAWPVAATQSDGDGRFAIKGVGRERLVEIVIRAPGLETSQKFARTRQGGVVKMGGPASPIPDDIQPSEFTFVLGPAVAIEGRVSDAETHQPLAGVRVQSTSTLFARAVTDALGRYRVEGLPLETNELAFLPPTGSRHLPGGVRVKTTAGSSSVVRNVTLTAGIVVQGRAIDERTGQPLRGLVQYFAYENNPLLKGTDSLCPFITGSGVAVHADGRFAIPALPGPGILGFLAGNQFAYGVGADRIDGPQFGDGRRSKMFKTVPEACMAYNFNLLVPLNPRAGDRDVVLDLKLRSGVDISARVLVSDGQPLGEYYVLGASGRGGWLRSTEDRFTVVGCFPMETRRLFMYHPARNLVALYDLTGVPPESPEITLRRGASIVGRVLDADGLPVPNALISSVSMTLLRASPGHLAEMKRDRGVLANSDGRRPFMTDAQGRFELKGIIPGLKYTAQVRVLRRMGSEPFPEFFTIFTDISAQSGETKQLGDLRLKALEDDAPQKRRSPSQTK